MFILTEEEEEEHPTSVRLAAWCDFQRGIYAGCCGGGEGVGADWIQSQFTFLEGNYWKHLQGGGGLIGSGNYWKHLYS